LFAPKRWDLGLWSIGIFAVLMFVLTKFAWKPILSSMHEREERIRGAIEQAEKTRREADELHLRLQAEMNQAAGRVREMIDEARRDGDVLKAKMIEDAKTEIATERDRLRREIELAKDTALEEIWQQSVQLAALMSTKALRRELKPEDHRRLLDETLAEMRRSQSTRRA
jgi:F-type H+-transporting ATPase subunit b